MSRIIELYLCRHAETTANRDDILQGHCDYELTDEGVEASLRTGSHLLSKQVSFDRVYSSDLPRAKKTCDLILQQMNRDVDSIITTDLLREISFGVREALPRGTSIEEAKQIISKRDKVALETIIDTAESNESSNKRALQFLNLIANDADTPAVSTILVLSHGAFLRNLVNKFVELPNKIEKLSNCSITHLQMHIDPNGSLSFPTIRSINSTSHL